MARIRRWKEKVALACFTLLFSVPRALALGGSNTASHRQVLYSRLVTLRSRETTLGLELMARRPFVRLIRTSRVPLPIALAPGALMAMAAPLAAPAPASSCPVCNTATALCCSLTAATCCDPNCVTTGTCYTVTFFNTERCVTCGYGTCHC